MPILLRSLLMPVRTNQVVIPITTNCLSRQIQLIHVRASGRSNRPYFLVIAPQQWVVVDDIVVNLRSCVEVLRRVLQRCREYKLKMKCAFGVTSEKFLGYLVNRQGMNVDPAKAKAVLDMPEPTSSINQVETSKQTMYGLGVRYEGLQKTTPKRKLAPEKFQLLLTYYLPGLTKISHSLF